MYVFSPIILAEIVIGVPATVVLISLVFKARSELTNTNVYLASLSASSFLQLVTAVLLFVMLIGQRWMLGNSVCALNAGIMAGGPLISLCCHLMIVRDKYKAVKHPSEWRWMKSKKAYVSTALAWIVGLFCALVLVSVHFEQGNVTENRNETTNFDCFVYDRYAPTFKKMAARIVILVIRGVVEYALIIITFFYHALLNQVLNDTNITLFDQRTAKSLFLIFMVQVIASQVEILYDVLDLLLQASRTEATMHVLEVLIVLTIFYIPALNPAILIISSSRYRQRVMRLLKGRFLAENMGEVLPSCRPRRLQPIASFPDLHVQTELTKQAFTEDYEYSVKGYGEADHSTVAVYVANRQSVTFSQESDFDKVDLPNMVPY